MTQMFHFDMKKTKTKPPTKLTKRDREKLFVKHNTAQLHRKVMEAQKLIVAANAMFTDLRMFSEPLAAYFNQKNGDSK